mgnify:CR=1 FL=1
MPPTGSQDGTNPTPGEKADAQTLADLTSVETPLDAQPPAAGQAEDTPEAAAVWVPIDAIRPWDRNPRINDTNVDRVAKSIKALGWGAVIVCRQDTGVIIAGHTRYEVAQKLGFTKVPVRFVDVDEDTAQRLAIADNKLQEHSSWDEQMLGELLGYLQDVEIPALDLVDLGFSDEELDDLISSALEDDSGSSGSSGSGGGGGDDDEIPDDVPPITVVGEVIG